MHLRVLVADVPRQFEHQPDCDAGGRIAERAGAAHSDAARLGRLCIDRGIAHPGGDQELQLGQRVDDFFRECGPLAHRNDDRKTLQRRNDLVGAAKMFVKYFDLDLVLDLGPVGELERHILVIVEDCATNRHFCRPSFAAQFSSSN